MRKIFFLLLFALPACTKSESPHVAKGVEVPHEAKGVEVPKQKWVDAMTTAFPAMLCPPKGFFRTCFQQTEDECLDQAMRAAKSCFLKIGPEMPAQVKQPEGGEEWGKKVGACTAETMEIALTGEKKKIDKPECGGASQWKE